VEGCYECGNEPSGSIKCGVFIIIVITAIGLSPGGSNPTLVRTKINRYNTKQL
jgi:hypothetical protein